jgi:hypothetical protein
MKVNGHPLALDTLHPGKEPLKLAGQEAAVSQSYSGCGCKQKNFGPARIKSLVVQPIASHFTDELSQLNGIFIGYEVFIFLYKFQFKMSLMNINFDSKNIYFCTPASTTLYILSLNFVCC